MHVTVFSLSVSFSSSSLLTRSTSLAPSLVHLSFIRPCVQITESTLEVLRQCVVDKVVDDEGDDEMGELALDGAVGPMDEDEGSDGGMRESSNSKPPSATEMDSDDAEAMQAMVDQAGVGPSWSLYMQRCREELLGTTRVSDEDDDGKERECWADMYSEPDSAITTQRLVEQLARLVSHVQSDHSSIEDVEKRFDTTEQCLSLNRTLFNNRAIFFQLLL